MKKLLKKILESDNITDVIFEDDLNTAEADTPSVNDPSFSKEEDNVNPEEGSLGDPEKETDISIDKSNEEDKGSEENSDSDSTSSDEES